MKLRTLSSLARSGNGLLMLRTTQLGASFFKVCFLAAASSSGLLAMLAQGAVAFERIAERLAPDPKAHEGLRAWLDFGVAAGVRGRCVCLRCVVETMVGSGESYGIAAVPDRARFAMPPAAACR